jgi:Derlin-2/3
MAQPFESWYKNMPLITKAYMTACFATTLAVYLEVVTPLNLFLNYRAIWDKHEVWRLVTPFLFFDYFGINFLFHMFFLYPYRL